MASPLTITSTKANPLYASLLTLREAGFSVENSVKFGSENAFEIEGYTLSNDAKIARFVAQVVSVDIQKALLGNDVDQRAEVRDLLLEMENFLEDGRAERLVTIEKKVADKLKKNGSLFAKRFTVADFTLWAIIAASADLQKKEAFAKLFEAVKNDSKFASVHKLVGKFEVAGPSGVGKQKKADEGKFIDLPGAEMGKVVVRFPPEASGYLHIGHAKAALLNQYYQKEFQGKLIMRFDDTNPAKENAHYEQVIKEDLDLLKIVPDVWTHSSDHFDTMLKYCEQLLREGKAYADDTDMETMRKEREERKESANRNNTPEKNLQMWAEMQKGSEEGQKCCIRIKMDMNSNNGAMRDPTIYRCKNEPHVRTGDKYKVYPTYDFACPIVDSTEGVTHALRTTEYMDRDDQYYFICDALRLRKPHIWAYSRLNMTNTVMSKRKLTWFVDEGHVSGWDDPRLPTVRGVMRRGLTVEGLKEFIRAQGGSRSVVMMEWDKIWAFNKKVIDPIAPRFTALDGSVKKLVPVVVNEQESTESSVNLHPKDAAIGTKSVWFTKNVWIEDVDAATIKEGDTVTFINWGNLKITKVTKEGDAVKEIVASLDLDNKDYKKTLKVTWLATCDPNESQPIPVRVAEYDHIISKAIVGKDEDWKQYINFNSLKHTDLQGEPAMKAIKKGDIVQIQRKGYYICDQVYGGPDAPLQLIAIPDGSKDTSAPAQNGKGKAEKKAAAPAKSSSTNGEEAAFAAEVAKQGELVRELKGKDAKSQETKDAIAKLVDLKKQYKEKFGADYKPQPAAPAPAKAAAPAAGAEESAFAAEIAKQGELVRDLKGKDAESQPTKDAIAKLLELKKQYKEKFGTDYKPQPAAPAPAKAAAPGGDESAFAAEIAKQGELVRDLKGKDAKSQATKDAIAKLLELKKQYKEKFGTDYKPQPAAPPATAAPAAGDEEAQFGAEITRQGDLVRELKGKDAKSQETKDAIAKLLALKAEFKSKFGKDFAPAGAAPSKGKKK